MASRPSISIHWLGALLCGVAAVCSAPSLALAQTWEYSPYNIRLWVAVESTTATLGLTELLQQEVAQGARRASGVVWRIFPEAAPSALQVDLLTRLDAISIEQVRAAIPGVFQVNPQLFGRHYVAAAGDGEMLALDKIVVVAVREVDQGYSIGIRELDVATQQWGDLFSSSTNQVEAVPGIALRQVIRAIRPIAKVEKVEGRSIVARLRAGGLIVAADSPAIVDSGRVMTPVIRRNSAKRAATPPSIYAPAWSYVSIEERKDTTILGTVHSGYGSVIPAKGGPRTERLLLGLTPQYSATRLELRARVTASSSGKAPPPLGRLLTGYEVYVKNPGEEKTELLGLTDWQGGIDLEPTDKPLRLFYIKNGGQMLGRLPYVVGQQPVITANVVDDDPRLAAESYIKSLQSRVLDLVARRQILQVRIRSKLKKGDYAGSKQLVTAFRSLPTAGQLTLELEDRQRRMSHVPGVTGKRIEKLFSDGHKLLQGFLDSADADKLAAEVVEAEKKGPPPAAPAEQETPTSEPTKTGDPVPPAA